MQNESRNSIPSEYRTDGVSPEVGGSIIYGGDEKTIEAGRSTVEPREQFSSTEINADTPVNKSASIKIPLSHFYQIYFSFGH